MANELRAEIAHWFDENDDGEFVQQPRTAPYSVVGPKSTPRRVLYSTKYLCVERLLGARLSGSSLGIVGRYGLPTEDVIPWLRDFVGDARLLFLGDFDPPDLLIFAWLRTCFDVEFLGIGDCLVSDLRVPITEATTIPLSGAEIEAGDLLLRVIPDFRDLTGPMCTSLWERGRKLELEALVSFGKTDASAVLDQICA